VHFHCSKVDALCDILFTKPLADSLSQSLAVVRLCIHDRLLRYYVAFDRILLFAFNPRTRELSRRPLRVLPRLLRLDFVSEDNIDPLPRTWPEELDSQTLYDFRLI
jgi:hypothetical protein